MTPKHQKHRYKRAVWRVPPRPFGVKPIRSVKNLFLFQREQALRLATYARVIQGYETGAQQSGTRANLRKLLAGKNGITLHQVNQFLRRDFNPLTAWDIAAWGFYGVYLPVMQKLYPDEANWFIRRFRIPLPVSSTAPSSQAHGKKAIPISPSQKKGDSKSEEPLFSTRAVQPLTKKGKLHLRKRRRGEIVARWKRKLSDAESLRINAIIEENMGLVYYVAKKFFFKIPAHLKGMIQRDDLIQWAMEGMQRAALVYDPKIGVKFSYYANVIMRNKILRELEQVYALTRNRIIHSLDQPVEDRHGRETVSANRIEDKRKLSFPTSPNRQLVVKSIQHSDLSPHEKRIVLLRFGLTEEGNRMTLEQVGKIFGLSPQRVSQIEQRAMAKLASNKALFRIWKAMAEE